MAKFTLDLSGRLGLVERHQGDLNDTTPAPHLRYLGAQGQLADGIYNPMKKYGYMSPATNAYTALTGTIGADINSIHYDAASDTVYLSEEGLNILKLDGLDDTSLANYTSVSSGSTIKDMLIYEINSKKALIYAIDDGTNINIGLSSLEAGGGVETLGVDVYSTGNGANIYQVVPTADESYGAYKYNKIAQSFSSSDLTGLTVSTIELGLSNKDIAVPSGVTIKVSIRADNDYNDSPHTYQGTWSGGTAYVLNDTVILSGVYYFCWTGHTNKEPGVAAGWEDYWYEFVGTPDSTELVSGTITADELAEYTSQGDTRISVNLSSQYTLTNATRYWVVVEESGTNLLTTESIVLMGTVNNGSIYSTHNVLGYDTTGGTDFWRNVNSNGDEFESLHIRFITSEVEDWSNIYASGKFTTDSGQETMLYLADNSLVYWITNNKIHTLDGSISGGVVGKVNENVLQFASYTTIKGIAETRSRMYIGVQTSSRTGESNDRYFTAKRAGVYVWDRRSQVLGSSDFYLAPGAKEIKALFPAYDGSVMAITESNSGFAEIRGASGNRYQPVHTFEKDGWPLSHRGITQLSSTLTVWLGANGIFYAFGEIAPGERPSLHKIGQQSTGTDFGPILVGNEYATNPSSAILLGLQVSASPKVYKWYPNGEGTLNSVSQIGHTGNVYTKVEYLPELTTVRDITIYCIPTTTSDGTTIATVKLYKNQQTTPFSTKTITNTDASRGYIKMRLNEKYVNALQMEIEFSTAEIAGDEEFYPSIATVSYDQTSTQTPDKG